MNIEYDYEYWNKNYEYWKINHDNHEYWKTSLNIFILVRTWFITWTEKFWYVPELYNAGTYQSLGRKIKADCLKFVNLTFLALLYFLAFFFALDNNLSGGVISRPWSRVPFLTFFLPFLELVMGLSVYISSLYVDSSSELKQWWSNEILWRVYTVAYSIDLSCPGGCAFLGSVRLKGWIQ